MRYYAIYFGLRGAFADGEDMVVLAVGDARELREAVADEVRHAIEAGYVPAFSPKGLARAVKDAWERLHESGYPMALPFRRQRHGSPGWAVFVARLSDAEARQLRRVTAMR